MNIFDFLTEISPWWWVAAALVLGALEMLTGTFVLIGPAVAAIFVAIALAVQPDMASIWQLLIFAVMSVVVTYVGRGVLQKYGDGGEGRASLNNRTKHLIGRTATVIEEGPSSGAVEIEGMRWRAAWPDGSALKAGDTVRVSGGDGMTLEVERAG